MVKLKSIPVRKTYVVSEHNMNPQINTKKIRLKAGKETLKSYEKIANALLEEKSVQLRQNLEFYCRDLINKSFSELRHDILQVESTLSARILQVESTIIKFDGVIEKLNIRTEDIQNGLAKSFSAEIEMERGKRLALSKKIQNQFENLVSACEKRIVASTKESTNAISSIQQEVQTNSRDLSSMREKIDEMLLKRYGFVPGKKVSGDNLSRSFNQGLDAGLIMDNLANRIKELELRLLDSEIQSNENDNVNISVHKLKKSLSQSPKKDSSASNRRPVDSDISILSYQIQECQREIRDLQDRHRSSEIEAAVVAADRDRGTRGQHQKQHLPQDIKLVSDLTEDVKTVRRKLKKLAENTTKACRSLSGGLCDVQQATLNLYSWADKAHDSFGLISDKLSMSVNMCPRAKIYNPTVRSDSQFIPQSDF